MLQSMTIKTLTDHNRIFAGTKGVGRENQRHGKGKRAAFA